MAPTSESLEHTRAALRNLFPPFVHEWAMLENAGGTPLPRPVVERMQDFYNARHVQMGGGYQLSKEVTASVADARAFLADFMQTRGEDGVERGRVVMGVACRVLVSHLAHAVFDRLLATAPDTPVHIIVANHNHDSNVKPWVALAERLQAAQRTCTLHRLEDANGDCPGLLSAGELEGVLAGIGGGAETFVIMPQVSNMLGEKVDARAMTELVHRYGGRIVLDGVAFATSDVPQCASWGADFYLVSMYKIFCPQLGVLYGRTDAWEWLYARDGVETGLAEMEQVSGVTNLPAYAGVLGFRDYLATVCRVSSGAPAAVDVRRMDSGGEPRVINDSFMSAVSAPEGVTAHADPVTVGVREPAPTGRVLIVRAMGVLRDLTFACSGYLRAGLSAIDGVEVMRSGDPLAPHCKPIVSFVPKARPVHDVAEHLYAAKLAVKQGLLMSPGMAQLLGVDKRGGVIRVSPAHYNTIDEMDRLLTAVREAVQVRA